MRMENNGSITVENDSTIRIERYEADFKKNSFYSTNGRWKVWQLIYKQNE